MNITKSELQLTIKACRDEVQEVRRALVRNDQFRIQMRRRGSDMGVGAENAKAVGFDSRGSHY